MMGLMHGVERFLAQGVSTGCWWVCVMALPRMRVWACGGLFTGHHRGVTEAGGAGRRTVVSGILYRLWWGAPEQVHRGCFYSFPRKS